MVFIGTVVEAFGRKLWLVFSSEGDYKIGQIEKSGFNLGDVVNIECYKDEFNRIVVKNIY